MLLLSLCKLRSANYFGGGFVEEMTIKPLVEAGFLLSALTNLTQTLYYRARIQTLKFKDTSNFKFHNKYIAPLESKASNTELAFFASLVGAKRNLDPKFRVKGLVNQARCLRRKTYNFFTPN